MKTGVILANFYISGTITNEKEVLKIISSGLDRIVFKSLRMSTNILKRPFDLPNFSLQISSSISLEVVEKIKTLGWIQLCKLSLRFFPAEGIFLAKSLPILETELKAFETSTESVISQSFNLKLICVAGF